MLSLGAGEAVRTKVGVEPVGQVVDPVGADDAECGQEGGVGGARGGDGQVVAERVGEDMVILGDEQDVFAELLGWEVGDDGTADGDRPFAGRSTPAMRRPSVVFPAPDEPTTASCSPARTSRLTPCRTSESS